jgi:hypothetical protein
VPVVAAAPAIAAWTNNVTITGASIKTVTPTPPVASCGPVSSTSITINWTARTAATGYRIRYGGLGDPKYETLPDTQTSKTFFDASTDGRFTVQTLYGGSWESAPSNEVAYKLADSKCTAF